MESVAKIALTILEELWGCTIDLEDAYFHLPICWFFQKFLAFRLDGETYVFQYLPFGLSVAPWAFTRIIKPIKAYLHRLKFRINSFLDDFFLLARTPLLLQKMTVIVLALFKKLGLSVNYKKSKLAPSQKVEYLGVIFHLKTQQLSLPEEKVVQISNLCQEVHYLPLYSRRQLESLLGLLSFAAPLVPLGRLKPSGSDLMDEHTYIHSLSRSESLPDKGVQEGSFSMAGSRFPKIASRYGSSSSFNTADDRRVRERLGRRYPSSQSMGCLVRRGSQSLHKLERTESSLPFSKGFSSLSEREISLDSVRQPDSNCLHHERRNSEISLLDGNDANSSGVRFVKLNSVSTQTSSREVEYPSRYGFQKRTHGNRMVAGQENIQLVGRKEWPSPSRPVCKQTEQTGKVLHFPLSRQSGNRDKCLVSGLESVGQHLLVPSGESLSKSDDLSIFLPGQGDFDSSRFSSGALVPSTSGEIQGAVQSARVPLFVSRDVQREGISSKPFNLSASRMETIEKALLEKNFSLGSASFINNSWKESTIRQYESIWKKFMAFLSARKIPHITIDPAIVCSFLEFNCKVLGRQYRTLATYKSSLSYPLKVARKLDLNDEDLVRFMRGVFSF